jgi:hypothetical protein
MTGSAQLPKAPPGGLVKRLIFWDFPRASWQYDLVVGLILLFIFLTPREWFHDQPKASPIVLLSSDQGAQQVFISTDLLEGLSGNDQLKRAENLIRQRTGKSWHVVRVEPISDEAEQEIKGFIAYTAP